MEEQVTAFATGRIAVPDTNAPTDHHKMRYAGENSRLLPSAYFLELES